MPTMKLYLIEQDDNDGYDTHDSAVVVAASATEAKKINPGGEDRWNDIWSTWASSPDKVTATCLGTANRRTRGIICRSFNAG